MILCEFMDSDPVKREFLETMRGITSTVTVISAKNNSLQQAMTATSVASLSLEPPAMLVCINHEASIHETKSHYRKSPGWRIKQSFSDNSTYT